MVILEEEFLKIPLDKNESITRKKSFIVGPDTTRTEARRIMDEKNTTFTNS